MSDFTNDAEKVLAKAQSLRDRCSEKVLKYGLPIGSATRDIAAGEHVHVQNMKSDYIWRPDR